MNKLIIFGAGEIAELADFYFKEHSEYKTVAFCVDDAYIKENTFCGKPVIPSSELTKKIFYERTFGIRRHVLRKNE